MSVICLSLVSNSPTKHYQVNSQTYPETSIASVSHRSTSPRTCPLKMKQSLSANCCQGHQTEDEHPGSTDLLEDGAMLRCSSPLPILTPSPEPEPLARYNTRSRARNLKRNWGVDPIMDSKQQEGRKRDRFR